MNEKINFREAVSIITGKQKFLKMNQKNTFDLISISEKKCSEIWDKSNYTDFSVYNTNDYLLQTVKTYKALSEGSIKNAIKYLENIEPDLKNFTILDDYNGCGLTTLLLSLNGYNVDYFNDCEIQVHTLEKLYEWKKLKLPNHRQKRLGKYDVVFSLEVIEHYKEPIIYLKELIKLVDENKYLIYTSGFANPNPYFWYGHFPTYIIDKKEVPYRTASRIINKELKKHFTVEKIFWNGKPRILKKKL